MQHLRFLVNALGKATPCKHKTTSITSHISTNIQSDQESALNLCRRHSSVQTFLRPSFHHGRLPKIGANKHKQLDIDQASSKVLPNTKHINRLIQGRKLLVRKKRIEVVSLSLTPVALCVKVSLFSTPNTFILCRVPIIRCIEVTCALES